MRRKYRVTLILAEGDKSEAWVWADSPEAAIKKAKGRVRPLVTIAAYAEPLKGESK